jgi:nicotinic acid mononucleotide adenylyltransferase
VAEWCEPRPGVLPAISSHGLYVDQAEAAARAFLGAEIVLALGADKVLQLFDPSWYEDPDRALDRLFQRATVVYAPRGGREEAVERMMGRLGARMSRVTRVALPDDLSDVSSSEVRRRVRGGQDVASSVPPEILPFLPRPR